MPAISSVGSMMQELKMPLTQIEDIFTKSEIAMMAWASREQVADLEKKPTSKRKKKLFSNHKSPERRLAEELTGEEFDDEQIDIDDSPKDLPRKYYNDQGELDLSKVTGREAVKYLGSMGLHFLPIVKG